jgi:predicted ATPase
VLSPAERITLQQETQGATPERRLRELATLLEALTQDSAGYVLPLLVLFLEDLQWSDYSTLDALAALARRRGAARLLVIGTFRPTEVLLNGHPL